MATQTAWRLVKAKYAERAFDGEGARIYPGRWNSAGVPVVYLAESRSLALLEILVHLQDTKLLASYVRFRVDFEAADCGHLEREALPADWRESPAPAALQSIGDEWATTLRSALLSVPSAIVPEERLYVLNPRHPRIDEVRVRGPEPVVLDPRLI